MRVGAILVILFASGVASAQQVKVQFSQAPHYAGEAIQVHVVAEGFDEDPTPTVQAPPPKGGILVQTGFQPNVSTQISIINGQFRRTKTVQFSFIYELTVPNPGKVAVGPFSVVQGKTRASAGRAVLDMRHSVTGLLLPEDGEGK